MKKMNTLIAVSTALLLAIPTSISAKPAVEGQLHKGFGGQKFKAVTPEQRAANKKARLAKMSPEQKAKWGAQQKERDARQAGQKAKIAARQAAQKAKRDVRQAGQKARRDARQAGQQEVMDNRKAFRELPGQASIGKGQKNAKIEARQQERLRKIEKLKAEREKLTNQLSDKGFAVLLANITVADLSKKNVKEALEVYLKKNPNAIIKITITAESVKGGFFNLDSTNIPPNLKHLVILDPKKLVKTIGRLFMGVKIKSVDISDLEAIEGIQDNFLSHTKIKKFNTSGLKALKKIGDYFFYGTPITALDISPLKSVQSIGEFFLDSTPLDGDKLRAEILGEPAPLSPADLQYNKDAEFFGVDLKADRKTFSAAWKAKLLALHPDKNNGVDRGTQEVQERWKRVKTYRKW